MERLTDRTEKGLICLNNNGDCGFIEQLIKAMEKLAEFEDFMEEQGFESLGDLKKALGRQFEIRETPFRYGQEINGVFFSNEQIMVLNQFTEFSESWLAKYKNSEAENQALKARWEKLKKFVNMPKEIQQWDERFEVTVDSIKAKMKELEEK